MNAPFRALTTAEPRRFSAAEFMKLYETGVFGAKERLRLIGGEVYAMASTGPEHAVGLGRVIGVLARALWPRFEIATDPILRFSEHQRLVGFREPGEGGYGARRDVEIGETIAPLCAPDAAIAIAELF